MLQGQLTAKLPGKSEKIDAWEEDELKGPKKWP